MSIAKAIAHLQLSNIVDEYFLNKGATMINTMTDTQLNRKISMFLGRKFEEFPEVYSTNI